MPQFQKFGEIVSGWFDRFPGPPGVLDYLAAAFFIVWTAVSLYGYIFRRRIFSGNGALIGMATRFGLYPIVIGFIGLVLLLSRYYQVVYLDMRFLLYLTVLAALGFAAFILYYLRRRYPARLAEVRAHELRRKYAPDRRRKKRGR